MSSSTRVEPRNGGDKESGRALALGGSRAEQKKMNHASFVDWAVLEVGGADST